MQGLIYLAVPVVLLILGYAVGKTRELAHLRSLAQREAAYAPLVTVTNLKRLPDGLRAADAFLCVGNVVIANDYWKTWVAGLKHIIGGRLRTLETLVERGRREAILRMVEAARQRGATHVLNVRLATSTIVRGQRDRAGGIEVLAYGTGIRARS